MEFLVFVPQMWFGGETSHGVAKYGLFCRATILIRVPNKVSALAAMFHGNHSTLQKILTWYLLFPLPGRVSFVWSQSGFLLARVAVGSFPKCMCDGMACCLSRACTQRNNCHKDMCTIGFSHKRQIQNQISFPKVSLKLHSKKPKATGKILIFQ